MDRFYTIKVASNVVPTKYCWNCNHLEEIKPRVQGSSPCGGTEGARNFGAVLLSKLFSPDRKGMLKVRSFMSSYNVSDFTDDEIISMSIRIWMAKKGITQMKRQPGEGQGEQAQAEACGVQQ